MQLRGRSVAVFGLAKSGLSAIALLVREGAHVTAVDAKPEHELGPTASSLRERGVKLSLPSAEVLRASELVVVSPGVPLSSPELEAARAAGVELIGEVELASRFLRGGTFLGITGTNGKSTTTALTGELFTRAGKRTFVGGNLGTPLSEAVLAGGDFEVYVVELSSFQLEGISKLRVNGAAILNLTPDHLDRYASHQSYGAAKARIFLNQTAEDFAVVNADDAAVVELARATPGRVTSFSSSGAGGATAVPSDGGFSIGAARFTVSNRALRGRHNLENAMAAALLARGAGLGTDAIQAGLDSYPGLPHRMESVRTLDGVEWINDSKATNVDSTLVALRSFEGGLWLIAGGKGKGAPYAPMVEASKGKVRGVLTIGADAPAITEAYEGVVPVVACRTLEIAVKRAWELSREGETVLLSPACASYDQFKNFEDRGDTFKKMVNALQSRPRKSMFEE